MTFTSRVVLYCSILVYTLLLLCALQVTIVSDLTQEALSVVTTADDLHLDATATTKEDLGQGHDLLISTGTLKRSTCNAFLQSTYMYMYVCIVSHTNCR